MHRCLLSLIGQTFPDKFGEVCISVCLDLKKNDLTGALALSGHGWHDDCMRLDYVSNKLNLFGSSQRGG